MDSGLMLAYASGLLARGLVSLPEPVLRAAAGPVPEVARGLEPEAWFLARLAGVSEKLASRRPPPPLDDQRRYTEAQSRFLTRTSHRPVQTRDDIAGGVPIRWYEPIDALPGALLVFFHGGGWVNRTVAAHDPAVRFLSDLSGVRIVSVEYRRAPEHPFPAAADDALAAYLAVEGAAERVAVGGDSAGGNLAASVAVAARDRGLRMPDFQWLLYPAVDAPRRHQSAKDFSTGFSLTEAAMDRYTELYLPDPGTRHDPRASPIYADPHGLPPAYVATSLADPLRDEGEAYAARLREAGVPAVVQRFGHIHGFFNMTGLRRAREFVAVTAGALRAGLR